MSVMFDGCRILLVEDEYLLAQDLRRELEDVGAVVLGPEPSVERAMALLDREFRIDAAILDVNLDGERVFPVADALAVRQVPFLFITGYRHEVVKSQFPGAMVCDKPLAAGHLVDALQNLMHGTDVRSRSV